MSEDERKLSIGATSRDVIKKDGKEYPIGVVIDEISIIVPPAEPAVPKAKFQVKEKGWI